MLQQSDSGFGRYCSAAADVIVPGQGLGANGLQVRDATSEGNSSTQEKLTTHESYNGHERYTRRENPTTRTRCHYITGSNQATSANA